MGNNPFMIQVRGQSWIDSRQFYYIAKPDMFTVSAVTEWIANKDSLGVQAQDENKVSTRSAKAYLWYTE